MKEEQPHKLELWMERKKLSPFLVSLFYVVEGPKMKEIIGAGWSEQFCIFKDNTVYFICASGEIHDFYKIHASYIQNTLKNTTGELMQKCLDVYNKADEHISNIAHASQDDFVKNIRMHLDSAYEIFMYTTTLPYFLLMATESDVLSSEYKNSIKEVCEKLRGDSKYVKVQNAFLPKLSKYLATEFAVSEQTALQFTYDEVVQIIENRSSFVLDPKINEREKLFMIEFNAEDTHDTLIYDESLIEKYLKQYVYVAKKDEITEFKGNIANKGYAKGRVVVVNSPDELDKVRDGDIVVSINTNPTIMPALVKCAAIVTD
ncbi:MAG: hypothetical protein RIT04_703, partial [Candidatus Parcubacteria bacterium]